MASFFDVCICVRLEVMHMSNKTMLMLFLLGNGIILRCVHMCGCRDHWFFIQDNVDAFPRKKWHHFAMCALKTTKQLFPLAFKELLCEACLARRKHSVRKVRVAQKKAPKVLCEAFLRRSSLRLLRRSECEAFLAPQERVLHEERAGVASKEVTRSSLKEIFLLKEIFEKRSFVTRRAFPAKKRFDCRRWSAPCFFETRYASQRSVSSAFEKAFLAQGKSVRIVCSVCFS